MINLRHITLFLRFFMCIAGLLTWPVFTFAQYESYSNAISNGLNQLKYLTENNMQDSEAFSSCFSETRAAFKLAMLEQDVLKSKAPAITINDTWRIISEWEVAIDWLEESFDSTFVYELNRRDYKENRELSKEQYNITPIEDLLYYGADYLGLGKSVFWLGQMDRHSEIPFHKAYLAARLGDIESFDVYLDQWMSSLLKRYDYYIKEYGGIKECFVAGLEDLSKALVDGAQYDYAIQLLAGWVLAQQESETPRYDLAEYLIRRLVSMHMEIGDYKNALLLCSIKAQAPLLSWHNINQGIYLSISYCEIVKSFDPNEALATALKLKDIIERDRSCDDGEKVTGITKSSVYNLLYQLYDEKGDYQKAHDYISKCIEIDGPHFQINHSNNLGFSYIKLGHYPEAEKVFEQCLAQIDSNKTFIDGKSTVLGNLIHVLELLNKPEKITYYAERYYDCVKDQFVSETMYMTPKALSNYFEYRSEARVLSEALVRSATKAPLCTGVAYNATIFQKGLVSRCNYNFRNNIINSDDDELKQLYQKYLESIMAGDEKSEEQLEASLSNAYSRHVYFPHSIDTYNWAHIRDVLKPDEAAIEFATHLDSSSGTVVQFYDALILRKSNQVPLLITLGRAEEIESFFLNKNSDGYTKIYETGGIEEPSKLIWGKIENEMKGIKTIYYSPTQELTRVNLDLLNSSVTGKTMMDTYRMVRLSSTIEILPKYENSISNSVLLCGGINHGSSALYNDSDYYVTRGSFTYLNNNGWGNLAKTAPEVDNIASRIKNKNDITVLTGNGVQETYIKSLSGHSPSIVHLATHGFYLTNSDAHKLNFYNGRYQEEQFIPATERIGLVLSDANLCWIGEKTSGGDDGTLTAQEIMGMDLSQTELVTLSACQTGLGEDSSDGTYGLQRAFKYAGVRSLIMSLWKVNDDATRLFMTTFYDSLSKGHDRHDAFTKAQKKVRGTKEYKSPYFWAAFVMVD